ncbi:Dolichyl-phosphate-mannose--protein mannosyltransferase 1 [Nakaseomyces bracarensis]|uniref:Dolichyl-phosphate-mannose--protein mannosyltransferase n=1 Tax=Nakaseomyces bracarensis TaxID=273131 RepID=A0ABR4NVC2_9SACH
MKEEKDVMDTIPDLKVHKGPLRPYVSFEGDEENAKKRTVSTYREKLMVAVLLLFTGVVRLYKLSWPSSVVFDEVHFGGFASKYIKGTFFMDVHPPLAKMLFAGVGSLAGYNGDFPFTPIGEEYTDDVPYYTMRLFSASLGIFTVLMLYLTLRASGVRLSVAYVFAFIFAIENSFVTISRYILLDAPMICFIAAAVYSFKKSELYPTNSFRYLKSLLATGVALGLAMSSKWVGLFTLTWVGLLCVWRLWFMIGDLQKSPFAIMKAAFAKLILLLAVPTALYVLFFYVHFQVLVNDDSGSSFFSSEFRATLNDNKIPKDTLAPVTFGSVVTLRHFATDGGYLHSHSHLYPKGSEQQQITLYPFLDHNNQWIVEDAKNKGTIPKDFIGLKNGAEISLLHGATSVRLHSHDHKPPVSENADWQKEVSGYGYPGFMGDYNDHWFIEIDKERSKKGIAQYEVRALDTKFKLRHITGCYLFSHDVKLPKWGFEQQEVTCASSGRPDLLIWFIEENQNDAVPDNKKEYVSYAPLSFLGKLKEYHQKMWSINKGLTGSHYYESQAYEWPLMNRGIGYWGEHHRKVYLLGNAVVWWSVSAFIVLYCAIVAYEAGAFLVGKPILQDKHVVNFHVQVVHYLLGFALHYFPFFFMGRQLFVHHYLPAYYFGILALAHLFDILLTFCFRRRNQIAYGLLILFAAGSVFYFQQHTPLAYGTEWSVQQCENSRWLDSWDFGCYAYFEDINQYKNFTYTPKHEGDASTESVVPPEKDEDRILDTMENPELIDQATPKKARKLLPEDEVENLLDDVEHKKFMDQDGNLLSPEQVKKLLENNNVKVEKEVIGEVHAT